MKQPDYLIVGAGAAGLAFADTIIDETDATVAIVDRRREVGGHWTDAYPFVQLHLSSALYGVNSTHLGADQRQTTGYNAGFYEQATGDEVCSYFEQVLHDRLEASGRVTFLGGHDYLTDSNGSTHAIRNLATGEATEVAPRRKIVDARYLETSIPETHKPNFSVAADVAFAPINDLPKLVEDYERFTIVGGGKTAFDACLWLIDHDIDPDRIRWVRPRDMWLTDRAGMQPLEDVGTLMDGVSREAAACAEFDSSDDIFLRLEEDGRMLRLDPSRPPTRWVGTMISRPEVEALRTINDVVALGRVRAIEDDRIVLTGGEVPAPPGTLYIDCSAIGLNQKPPTPVFSKDRITVQNVRYNSPSFNAALIAWVEANRDGEDQNRLTPPNRFVTDPADYPAVLCRTWMTGIAWTQDSELSKWIDASRLNIMKGLKDRLAEPVALAGIRRYMSNLGPAVARHQPSVQRLFG